MAIRPSGYGGFNVTIEGADHKVEQGQDLKVKIGDQVKKGDAISTGVVKSQELVALKGVGETQTKMREDLYDAFAAADIRFHKRTYELPVKMLTENVRIIDPGACPDFVAGDYSNVSKVEAWNKSNPGKKQIRYKVELVGMGQVAYKTNDWAQRMSLGRIEQTITEGAGMGFESSRKETPFAHLALGPNTTIPKANQRFPR
jgi:DNA-directed RNA polymerase subunit beta'